MKNQDVVVKQDEKEMVPVEVIAENIVEISRGFNKALSSGLTKEAIVLLVHDSCVNVGKTAIRAVLSVLPKLEERYTTKKK